MNKVIFIISLLIISACTVIKTPAISQTNKDDGKVQTSYTYGLFESPNLQLDVTKNSVNAQCKNWGYQDAKHTVGPEKECISKDKYGHIDPEAQCISWQVSDLYECKLSPEQQAANNDKKQKAILAQQEAQQKEEQAQQAFLNNLSSFTYLFDCSAWGVAGEGMVNNLLGAWVSGNTSNYSMLITSAYKNECSHHNEEMSKTKALGLIENGKLVLQENGVAYYTVQLPTKQNEKNITLVIYAR